MLVNRLGSVLPQALFRLRCSLATASSPLREGDRISKKRSFSRSDVLTFSLLTGDSNPVHTSGPNGREARSSAFGDPKEEGVVQGALVASLFPAIVGSEVPGSVLVKESVAFRRPAYAEEELEVEVRVLQRRGRWVRFGTACRRGDEVIADGEVLALFPQEEEA